MTERADRAQQRINDAALAAAINALAGAVANFNRQGNNNNNPHQPVHDLFQANDAFDLSTRSGMQAFEEISKPLIDKWDGSIATFPTFIINLKLRANKGRWNATGDTGITRINNNEIFTAYHSISDLEIETARINRTNPRAVQNSKALYRCIESSITGDVRTTIFTQAENIPEHEDGIALFKKVTIFTAVSSIQLSNLSLQQILEFNPADAEFAIPTINTQLINLFVLATTRSRILDENERIQHTLNAYSKILQPELWAQWTRNRTEDFEEGRLATCQQLMNSAVLKYKKIKAEQGDFKGSITTVQEDIVAMFAKRTDNKRKNDDLDDDQKFGSKKPKFEPRGSNSDQPAFVKNTYYYKDGNKNNFKVGDTKNVKGTTWYFCDCTNHREQIHWHTFTAEQCRTRKRWLKRQNKINANLANGGDDKDPGNDATENQNQEETPGIDETSTSNCDESRTSSITSGSGSLGSDVQALLASALNMTQDNHVLRDAIADAINAANA